MRDWLPWVILAIFLMGLGVSSSATRTIGYLGGTPPVITNGTATTTVATIVTGAGSANVQWRLCDEDTAATMRCEFGTTANGAPTTPPTASVGVAVLNNSCYVETVAPNNRVDCLTTSGTAKYSLTIYPR